MKQKLKNLWNYFTTYEKIWFISITVLAFAFAIIFPEEDFGGVNGKVIMALYLLDIFLNITCELLISKQSKWNFIVSLGVEITEKQVTTVYAMGSYFGIQTPDIMYEASSVILAGGVVMGKPFPGEDELLGRGVSYCAKVDGAEYKGKRVAAIATVPDAMEEIEYLADICSEVIFIPRFQGFVAPKRKNVTVVLDQPTDITGTDRVTGLHTTGEFFSVQAVFMFRASDPLNSFLPGLQMRGRSVLVDDQAETSIEGVFAGGDCTGQPWQVNRAAGQAQKAAISAINYLAKRDGLIETFKEYS